MFLQKNIYIGINYYILLTMILIISTFSDRKKEVGSIIHLNIFSSPISYHCMNIKVLIPLGKSLILRITSYALFMQ